MKDFTYSYPTHVYFGKGVLANALKTEAQPRYGGAMFVRMEAGWQHV